MAKPVVIAETGNLRIEVEQDNDVLTIRPIGVINEDFDFGNIINFISGLKESIRSLSFDMSKVNQFNSCGTREWLLFMERVPNALPCQFTVVNEVFVKQTSMIANMLGKRGTRVLAIELPYFCERCNQPHSRVFKSESIEQKDGKHVAPALKCPTCGNDLEFDAIEEEYFTLLKYTKAS